MKDPKINIIITGLCMVRDKYCDGYNNDNDCLSCTLFQPSEAFKNTIKELLNCPDLDPDDFIYDLIIYLTEHTNYNKMKDKKN